MSAAGDRCRVKSPHYKNERGESMCSCHLKKGHKGHHASFSPSSRGMHRWGAESFEAPKKYRDYPEWLTVKERAVFHKVRGNIGGLMDRIEESNLYKVKTYKEAQKWLENYW